jgi:hypothetical protein
LVYSTHFGGYVDSGSAIAVDGSGNAYVTGGTECPFPTTPGAFQTTCGVNGGAFVSKLSAAGSALVYSTYLGESDYSGPTGGNGIAVDASGNAYITGQTYSSNFPTTPGAFQTASPHAGSGHAFVSKLNATGSALVYSTYLGGNFVDAGGGIAVDASRNAYLVGWTASSNFPTTPGAFQSTLAGSGHAFVSKLNAIGSALVYSTYLGGSGYDHGWGIAVDPSGNAYATGVTSSSNFPTTPGAVQATYGGGQNDAFLSKLNATGSALLYSTLLGGTQADTGWGIAVDASGNAYVTGWTESSDFPTTPGAFQTTFGGETSGFVSKLSLGTFGNPGR